MTLNPLDIFEDIIPDHNLLRSQLGTTPPPVSETEVEDADGLEEKVDADGNGMRETHLEQGAEEAGEESWNTVDEEQAVMETSQLKSRHASDTPKGQSPGHDSLRAAAAARVRGTQTQNETGGNLYDT